MHTFLNRLGRLTAAHPWRTLAAWLVLLTTVLGLAATVGGTTQDDYDVDDARGQVGVEMLRDHLPAFGNGFARVVVHDPEGEAADAEVLADLAGRLAAMDHVAVVSPPSTSPDGDTALLLVSYAEPVTHPDLMGNMEPLQAAVAPTEAAGYRVELGGDVPESAAAPMAGHGELIGVATALIILVLAFGSVVAAGLGVGSGGILLLAAVMDVSTAAPTVATMVGLGVGIDYALLLVSRHVEYLREGHPPVEAAARATTTAGRSVVFAAATVLVSLMGLRLSGLPVYDSFGFATAIAVLSVMVAALTLVPALCRLAGNRLLPRAEQRPARARRAPFTRRWAERVGRRPLPWALAATAVMVTLAVPALEMRTWPQDPSSQSADLTTRRAYDLVAEEFGAGANGRMILVVDHDLVPADEVPTVTDLVATHEHVVGVGPAMLSPDGAISVFEATPAFGPTDDRTGPLVDSLRSQLPDGVEVTGTTPIFADLADMLAERLPLVIGFVVGISVLLLTLMFRSVVVPVKAALMNLLSIAAAYGVMTAVFQWGWGAELFGLDHALPVSSWVPILMFAILFGLSMDYEVFLLSRIREEWVRTGDARGSVVAGLASTGRVISCAAAIMVAVFLGFASEVDVVVKMLGLGMAVAILLDATVVRMVLVPATMALLGRWNWYLPRWLDRILPEVRLEVDDETGAEADELDQELAELADGTRPEHSAEPAGV